MNNNKVIKFTRSRAKNALRHNGKFESQTASRVPLLNGIASHTIGATSERNKIAICAGKMHRKIIKRKYAEIKDAADIKSELSCFNTIKSYFITHTYFMIKRTFLLVLALETFKIIQQVLQIK